MAHFLADHRETILCPHLLWLYLRGDDADVVPLGLHLSDEPHNARIFAARIDKRAKDVGFQHFAKVHQHRAVLAATESEIHLAIHPADELVYHSERMVNFLMQRPSLPLI